MKIKKKEGSEKRNLERTNWLQEEKLKKDKKDVKKEEGNEEINL